MARSRNRALVLEIVADPKKAQKGLKGIQGSITKFAGKMAVTAGAYFGTKALLDFGKASISAASDLEESTNAVERAMGSAAGAVKELGTDSASALGLSKTGLNELAVSFAAFGEKIKPGASGDAFGEIIQRATDFASVMNIDVEAAMGTFQSALAGQSQPIRQYGIDLSAAAVQAYALTSGIWSGNGAISEAEKIQARYGLILQETEQYAGDFAATSDGLANSTRILSAEWADLQAELGKQALPLAADGVNVLVGAVQNAEHYTLRLGGALAEARSYAQTLAGELLGSWSFGTIGGDMQASGEWNHALAQIINSQKLYHRELASGATTQHAYMSAQARLVKSGEATSATHGLLAEAIGATDAEYLLSLKALRDVAAENGITGKSYEDLEHAIQLHNQYLRTDGRDAIEKQTSQWGSYVEALERAAGATGELGGATERVITPVDTLISHLGDLEAARNGAIAPPSLIWDIDSWGRMWGDEISNLTTLWNDFKYAREHAVSGSTSGSYSDGTYTPPGGRTGQAPAIEVNIQAGIMTDPAEIGREVRGVLNAYASVGGS